MEHLRFHVVAVFLAVAVSLLAAGQGQPFSQICGDTGNYAANSTYQANLSQLSTTLPTNASTSPTLFAAATAGSVPDEVSALALCRGDDNSSACLACVANAFSDAQNLCPYNKDVTIYYDPCLLRYSNLHFLTSTANSKEIIGANAQNVTSPAARFDAAVAALMNATADYAASNSSKKFATSDKIFDENYPKIYGLAQCTPDLAAADCRSCLGDLIGMMPKYFSGRQGGRILGVRCNLRYEVYPFYDGAAMLQLPAESPAPAQAPEATTAPPGGKKKASVQVLAIVLPIVIALFAVILIYFCVRRKGRSPREAPLDYFGDVEDVRSAESLLLDLSTLRAATANFDDSNKLGRGGFGAVYKGVLPNGKEVAVKRLSQCSRQGLGELKNELILVAKLQHRNLVRVMGVCLEEEEKLLVYEFMPNRSLDTILFDPEKSKQLDWGKRYKIINGVARGLQYLHDESQLKIVHRDLKASNILLDTDMNPKISDFGLARLFGGDQTQLVTDRVVGTFGYMAPEYAMHGYYSTKSDVFSFGVLLLEIVTGRRNSGSYNSEQSEDLISLIWEHWDMETITEIMDPFLSSHCPTGEMSRCINIGLLCVQDNPADRPSLLSVIVMLGSHSVSLQAPSRPAYCVRNSMTYLDLYSQSHSHGVRDESITGLDRR